MTRIAPADVRRQDLIEGLGRGLRVIEAFDEDHPRLTASEAAERAGLTRAAARRHLLSLVHFGYAAGDGRQFWLLPRVLRLGQSYLATARLPRLTQPFAQRLAAQCGETVNVSVLDGHEVVYVARSAPPHWVSIGYAVGTRVPAHVVTPGVIILSTMDDAVVDTWIAGHDFAAFTASTVTDPALFRESVRRARAQDFWATWQQLDPGLAGLGVALKDRRGHCHGAIGMTVSSARYTPEKMADTLLPPLRETAQALRALL